MRLILRALLPPQSLHFGPSSGPRPLAKLKLRGEQQGSKRATTERCTGASGCHFWHQVCPIFRLWSVIGSLRALRCQGAGLPALRIIAQGLRRTRSTRERCGTRPFEDCETHEHIAPRSALFGTQRRGGVERRRSAAPRAAPLYIKPRWASPNSTPGW